MTRKGRQIVRETIGAPSVPPKPGFSYSGEAKFDLVAGDEYGFIMTGSDSGAGRLEGKLSLRMRDMTPPVITPAVTGTLGKNGFYTSDAKVTWTVDETDTPFTKSGCDAVTVATDTAGKTFTCSAQSDGGKASKSVTIKRDATAPALTLPGTLVAEGGAADGRVVDYAAGATDAVDASPAVSCSPASGSKFPLGATRVDCTAADAAGNKAAAGFDVIVLRAPDPVPTATPAPTVAPSVTEVHMGGPVTITQAPKQLNPVLAFRFTVSKRMTQLKQLIVKNLPAGSTATVSCKGASCPKKLRGRTFAQRITKSSLDISSLVRGRLKAGTVISVVVSSPDAVTATKKLTVRKNGAPQVG